MVMPRDLPMQLHLWLHVIQQSYLIVSLPSPSIPFDFVLYPHHKMTDWRENDYWSVLQLRSTLHDSVTTIRGEAPRVLKKIKNFRWW